MANEVIIEEYERFDERIQAPTEWITTQILDIAELSAKMNDKTRYIRIRSNASAFWYTIGNSSASATANTAGSSRIPADGFADHVVGKGVYVDTAS